jgi:hypothetical protein
MRDLQDPVGFIATARSPNPQEHAQWLMMAAEARDTRPP